MRIKLRGEIDPQRVVRIARILKAREEELLILSRLSSEEQARYLEAPFPSLDRECEVMLSLHAAAVQELRGKSPGWILMVC